MGKASASTKPGQEEQILQSFFPEIMPAVSVIWPFKSSQHIRNQAIFMINLPHQNARMVAKQSDNLFLSEDLGHFKSII